MKNRKMRKGKSQPRARGAGVPQVQMGISNPTDFDRRERKVIIGHETVKIDNQEVKKAIWGQATVYTRR